MLAPVLSVMPARPAGRATPAGSPARRARGRAGGGRSTTRRRPPNRAGAARAAGVAVRRRRRRGHSSRHSIPPALGSARSSSATRLRRSRTGYPSTSAPRPDQHAPATRWNQRRGRRSSTGRRACSAGPAGRPAAPGHAVATRAQLLGVDAPAQRALAAPAPCGRCRRPAPAGRAWRDRQHRDPATAPTCAARSARLRWTTAAVDVQAGAAAADHVEASCVWKPARRCRRAAAPWEIA